MLTASKGAAWSSISGYCILIMLLLDLGASRAAATPLFPDGLPEREFKSFEAAGFSKPVHGVIFHGERGPCCGVALGGLGTGCLDVMAEGVFGFCTAYPAPRRRPMEHYKPYQAYYRNPQLLLPFLGLSVNGQTWVLAKEKFVKGGTLHGCVEPGMGRDLVDKPDWLKAWESHVPPIEGVKSATRIEYWGHFPIADLKYETDAPVKVALRSWAPFLPGDIITSNTPGAVFEVHLANKTQTAQAGTIAFNFPGPKGAASDIELFEHTVSRRPYPALSVSSVDGEMGFTVAALGDGKARFGGDLSGAPSGWSQIHKSLPKARAKTIDGKQGNADSGGSAALDFHLKPGEEKVVRFVLGWFARGWQAGPWKDLKYSFERKGFEPGDWKIPGRETPEGPRYSYRYTSRFSSSRDVASKLVAEHQSLLSRTLAWQQEIYAGEGLPGWLTDCLINNLNIIPKTSYWAQPGSYEWSEPLGQFGMDESPRGCSIMGCIVSNWYGDWPVMYLFPEIEKMILRNYKYYQRPDGAAAFLFPSGDFNSPTYEWLLPLNANCFVDLIARLWRRTGDDDILQEFYPAAKLATTFATTLKPGPEGVISVHREGKGQEWWEHTPVFGMVTHAAGMRLSTLHLAKEMAESIGDTAYAVQCEKWLKDGTEALEHHLWADDSYLFFNDPLGTGKRNDDILSAQLDGDWANFIHGLPGVFRDDRAKKSLQTIKRTCFVDYGLVGFATRDGGPQFEGYGSFCAETCIVGMTYMYHGDTKFGSEIIRRHMENLVCQQGHGWDLPNMIRCDNGKRYFGTDYFQNMVIWSIPAALARKDLAWPCRPGGLVDRVMKAATPPPD